MFVCLILIKCWKNHNVRYRFSTLKKIIQRIKEWMQMVYESRKRGNVLFLTAFVHLSETRCKSTHLWWSCYM